MRVENYLEESNHEQVCGLVVMMVGRVCWVAWGVDVCVANEERNERDHQSKFLDQPIGSTVVAYL